MAINIIRGSIGSGKSSKCIEMISEIKENFPEHKCVMLVPNHYSYETEKRFVEKFGGTGLNNIEVVTLRKLAGNLLDKKSINYITASGRQMLIHKAVQKFCEDAKEIDDMRLILTMKKQGFNEVMSSLISEFKRYMVTPLMLLESAEKITDNKTLKNKLIAAAKIYDRYMSYIDESDYTDSEDDEERLAKVIAQTDYFDENTHIWIDSFDVFTPKQLAVIEAMAKRGLDVTISLCSPTRKNLLYKELESTVEDIEAIANNYGKGQIIDCGDEFKGNKSEEIKFLLENWNNDSAIYRRETKDIVRFCEYDIYNEVEKCACHIIDLVREENMRYRDIAILCGDTESYNHIIETVFDEYEIPYFTDSKIALSDHSIAMQILSVFDIFENDWSYEAVFEYLKSGFVFSEREVGGKKMVVPINPSDIDYLENYVLKHGISGSKRWTSEEVWSKEVSDLAYVFSNDKKSEADERIDVLRREIIRPLNTLYEKIKGKGTAQKYARALFEFLCDINLYKGLKSEIRIMRESGFLNEAEQFTKIWNLIIDALNQVTVALKDEEISFLMFGEYLRAGLSKCEIRVIPSGIDRVYVGNVEKCLAADARAVFIIGAVGGTFPSDITTEGFFSNVDRQTMSSDYGIRIAPDTKRKMEKQAFKVYRAICGVQEKLYISRPLQDGSGKALTAAGMVNDIERLFPLIRNLDSNDESIYISTPKATIHRMLINKSKHNKGNVLWETVYDWYKEKEEWKPMLSLLDRTARYVKHDVKLDSEFAGKLYEQKNTYSASRLNTFSECPFQYFLKFGLKLQEREVWEISPADVGSYAHEIIREFCEIVEEGGTESEQKLLAWKNLTEKNRNEIIDYLIDIRCKNIEDKAFRDKGKTISILKRTGRNIKNAAAVVHRALSEGEYTQQGLEKSFEYFINEDIGIKGIIDRMDVVSDEEGTRVRIIDYKTGKTEFDVVNIANGIDMQMVIYAIAAKAMAKELYGENVNISGIYYNKVHNNAINVGMGVNKAEVNEYRNSMVKLDGVTFSQADVMMYENAQPGHNLLGIEYYKNGKMKNKDAVHTYEEIDGLMDFVREKIISIDGDIKNGVINSMPYCRSTSFSACAYCDYTSVCAFSNNKTPRKKTGTVDEVWAAMHSVDEKEGDE